jgi:deoxyribodipyrimidine photolyase-related protein
MVTNKKIGIIFPHQLFEQNILLSTCNTIYLIEEWLYFKQYNFHKSKIAFHRASMKFYEVYLQSKNIKVIYIESIDVLSDIRKLIPFLKSIGVDEIEYIDTTDYWLEKRIKDSCLNQNIICHKNDTSQFLNTVEDIYNYFKDKKRNRMESENCHRRRN